MTGGDRDSPIQLLVNYWEIPPSQMGGYLDSLYQRGVKAVTTFVPWQVFESDISHSLARFIQNATEKGIRVALIVTPEVGIHYARSGLPKDLVSQPEGLARNDGEVQVSLPPQTFALPSILAPAFSKRYYSYLSRINAFLVDVNHDKVEVVITGSFWKYYRSAATTANRPFFGRAGDLSKSSGIEYRRFVDKKFSEAEFLDSDPSGVSWWKTRGLDELNFRAFQQDVEDYFRRRTDAAVRRHIPALRTRAIELFTPEADPALNYSRFLQNIAGGTVDFSLLSQLIDEYSARGAAVDGQLAPSYVHWSSLGGFRDLSEAERQFLLLKTLLQIGAQGGGMYIEAGEWFSFSQGFRSKAELVAASIARKELSLAPRAVFLTSHLWSTGNARGKKTATDLGFEGVEMWNVLFRGLGASARMAASASYLTEADLARIAIVDPTYVIDLKTISRLLSWVQRGRVIVLPRSSMYSASAKLALERVTHDSAEPLTVELGLPFTIYDHGKGKVILFDLPGGSAEQNRSRYASFVNSVLNAAEIKKVCSVSDGRLRALSLVRRVEGGKGLGLFVLNATERSVAADVIFSSSVGVSDLALAISKDSGAERSQGRRFSLEVPPFGVLPLAVDGVDLEWAENEPQKPKESPEEAGVVS